MSVRILHVVGGMNRGGIETWLMHVLRHIDRGEFRMDFAVQTDATCAYDAEVRHLGSRIIPCLHPRNPWRYARSFRGVLRECGPYDVVHSHVHHYSGFVLKLAKTCGVPVRIAHCHTDTSAADCSAGLLRRSYLGLCTRWIRDCATMRVACSRNAAQALFGTDWAQSANTLLLPCGVDFRPFHEAVDRTEIRDELGIPRDAFVLGHVGRFCRAKNHRFLLEIAADVMRREPQAMLLLVGDGPDRGQTERLAESLGVRDRVIFAGPRADVHRILLGAMDVFVFPSLWEGMPLSLVEAQAANLPCFVSDVVSKESDIVPAMIHRLSLHQSAADWASAAIRQGRALRDVDRAQALAIVERSNFSIGKSVGALESVWKMSFRGTRYAA